MRIASHRIVRVVPLSRDDFVSVSYSRRATSSSCVRTPTPSSVSRASVSVEDARDRWGQSWDILGDGDVTIVTSRHPVERTNRDSASRVTTTWDATAEWEDAVVVVRAVAVRAGRRRRRRRVMGARTRLRAGHRWVGKRTGKGRGEEGRCRCRMHRER